MSLFPIYLIPIEREETLLVAERPLAGRLITSLSQQSPLEELLKLLERIQKAVWNKFTLTLTSRSFALSLFYPYPNQPIPIITSITSPSERLKILRALTLYIQDYAQTNFPELFESIDSVATKQCQNLILAFDKALSLNLLDRASPLPDLQTRSSVPSQKRKYPEPNSSSDEKEIPSAKKHKIASTKTSSTSHQRSLSPPTSSTILEIKPSDASSLPSFLPFESSDIEESEYEEEEILLPESLVPLPSQIYPKPQKQIAIPITSEDKSLEMKTTCPTTPISPLTMQSTEQILSHRFVRIHFSNPFSPIFRLIPQRILASTSDFFLFLNHVHKASSCQSYNCNHLIPEITPMVAIKNRNLVLRALFAIVLRNHYFFSTFIVTSPLPTLRKAVTDILTHLNMLYCELNPPREIIKPYHPDLQILLIDPTHPPKEIIISSFQWLSLNLRQNMLNTFQITITHFQKEYGIKSQLRALARHLKNSVPIYENFVQHDHLFVQSYESSIQLSHIQEESLNRQQALNLISSILTENVAYYKTHFAEITKILQEGTLQTYIDSINSSLKKIRRILYPLQPAIPKVPETPVITVPATIEAQPTHPSTSSSAEVLEENLHAKNHATPTITFFKISYLERNKTFSISSKTYTPTPLLFTNFLSQINKIITVPSFVCLSNIPGIPKNSDNDPLKTLKTLFFLTCTYTFNYQKYKPFIPPSVLTQLRTTLEKINETYYKMSCSGETTPSIPALSYHPELKTIGESLQIFNLLQCQPKCFFFNFSNLSISPKKSTILIFPYIYEHQQIGPLFSAIQNNLTNIRRQLERIINDPSLTIITIESLDPLIPIPPTKISQNMALKKCKEILLKMSHDLSQDQILRPFSDQLCFINTRYKINEICNIINASIRNPYFSTNPTAVPIFLFQISKKAHRVLLQVQKYLPLRKHQKNINISIPTTITFKWLKEYFSKEAIIPQSQTLCHKNMDTKAEISSKHPQIFLSYIYRGLKQNLLQVEKLFFHMQSDDSLLQTLPSVKETLDTIKASLYFVKTLFPTPQDKQKLEEINPIFQASLFSQQKMNALLAEIKHLYQQQGKETDFDSSEEKG